MKDSDLTTIFLCFQKTGLYFTREDTNAVGLAFIEELKKHNAEFQPTKVEQREWNKTFMVNAYPTQFEPLIMACIEERRKSHDLRPRRERPKAPPRFSRDRGGYNRDSGNSQNRSFNRDRNLNRDDGNQRNANDERGQSFRPRREFSSDDSSGNSRNLNRDDGGHLKRPRRRRIIKPLNPDQDKSSPPDNNPPDIDKSGPPDNNSPDTDK